MIRNLIERWTKQRSHVAPADTTPHDYGCPECGVQNDLFIHAATVAPLRHLDGCDRAEAPVGGNWTDANGMHCGACGWRGPAGAGRRDRLPMPRPNRTAATGLRRARAA